MRLIATQYRLFFIDDESDQLEQMISAAERLGYIATGTSDPSAAIELARGALPDLIICDLQMPRIDGRDILSRAKRDSALRGIPIVIMAEPTDDYCRALCVAYGAAAFVSKHTAQSRLRATVEAALRAGRAERETISKVLRPPTRLYLWPTRP